MKQLTVPTKIIALTSFILVLDFLKPSVLYTKSGEPRQFGLGVDAFGHKKTLLDIRWLIILMCVFLVKFKIRA